jgi:hypothetical protein
MEKAVNSKRTQMLTLDYNPLVQAVVDAWRARLPKDTAGGTLEISESDLRELIVQLCRAVDLLAEAMDTEALLKRLRSQMPGLSPGQGTPRCPVHP